MHSAQPASIRDYFYVSVLVRTDLKKQNKKREFGQMYKVGLSYLPRAPTLVWTNAFLIILPTFSISLGIFNRLLFLGDVNKLRHSCYDLPRPPLVILRHLLAPPP